MITSVRICRGQTANSRLLAAWTHNPPVVGTMPSTAYSMPNSPLLAPLPPGWRFAGRGKKGPACESDEVLAGPAGRGRGSARAVPGLVLHVLLARGRPGALAARHGIGEGGRAVVGQDAA